MSINTAHANGGVLIYNGEIILLYCDGVQLDVEGGDAKEFGGTKKGRIYLTTHRMIFSNKSEKDNLQSMSFPFFSLSGVELEQPIFGANYIKGIVHAQPGGYWSGKAVFKLKFFSGGAIEFGQAMVKAAKMASQYMPPQPPPYMPHSGPYFPAPPPAYMPPQGGIGFNLPTQTFPDQPPANSVFTTDMPPPYPGIYPPGQSGMPPGSAPPPSGYDAQGGATAPPPYSNAQGPYPQQPGAYPPQQPGAYPPQQPGAYPPQQPGAYPQQNGAYPPPQNGYTQQAASTDSKPPFPPVQGYTMYPSNPHMLYMQPQPGVQYMMNQEPPPPYFPENNKKEQ